MAVSRSTGLGILIDRQQQIVRRDIYYASFGKTINPRTLYNRIFWIERARHIVRFSFGAPETKFQASFALAFVGRMFVTFVFQKKHSDAST